MELLVSFIILIVIGAFGAVVVGIFFYKRIYTRTKEQFWRLVNFLAIVDLITDEVGMHQLNGAFGTKPSFDKNTDIYTWRKLDEQGKEIILSAFVLKGARQGYLAFTTLGDSYAKYFFS